jgi:hypothetical protein
MNVYWSQEEFDQMTRGYLDHGTTANTSVCSVRT